MSVPSAFSPLAAPESQGLDSRALAGTLDRIRDDNLKIDSILVARNGKIVLDAYRFPYRAGMRHDMASVTKSVTALVVGAALADRDAFGMSEPLTADGAMTVGDALSMTTGLACGQSSGEAAQLAEMQATPDWAQYVVELARLQAAGTHFSYCSPGYHLVSAFISKTTGKSLELNAQEKLFSPLGITDWYWPKDPLGRTIGWGDLSLHPRDTARIGQMILDGGRFQGKRVLSEAWIARATTEQIKTGQGDEGYGYGFWRPADHPDRIVLRGRGGQLVVLTPAENLMVVVTGTGYPEVSIHSLNSSTEATDRPGTESSAGQSELARACKRFALRPIATAARPHGQLANGLLGQSLQVVGANALGLREIVVNQSGSEGLLAATLLGESFDVPVGFDGVPRITMDGMRGAPMGAIADWTALDQLRLEVTIYGLALRLIFDFDFRTIDTVAIHLTEGTGFFAFDTMAIRSN